MEPVGPPAAGRTEYGPAVAGLASSGLGRNFVGRMGATESPPCETVVVLSGRLRIGGASDVEVVEEMDEFETVRMGEKVDMADPGRAGKFFAANAAFF